MGKHPWPSWWDEVPHPDVPFPAFSVHDGLPSSPEEVIEIALEEDACRNSNPV
jgi:hypothetical protein